MTIRIINSNDYHDFVFQNGVLIGEFEQMYQKSDQIPWHQDYQEDWLDIRITIELLKKIGPFDMVCDFGSGLGYFLNILRKAVTVPGSKIIGIDISETACIKAKETFPDLSFIPSDFTKLYGSRLFKDLNFSNRLFVIRGTLWYVFPHIEDVLLNIALHMERRDTLLVSQNFPPLDCNFVGKNVFPNPDSVISVFSGKFTIIQSVWLQDHNSSGNDNWFIGLFKKKE